MPELEEMHMMKDSNGYRAVPVARSLKYQQGGSKPDPYVSRAVERVRKKIKDRIFQIGGDA